MLKLTHVFDHHKHNVCTEKHNTHFHEFDVDCEFYKFKITSQYCHQFQNVSFYTFQKNYKIVNSKYDFISCLQQLQISLRGPPIT